MNFNVFIRKNIFISIQILNYLDIQITSHSGKFSTRYIRTPLTQYVLLLTKGQSMWNDIGWQHPNERRTLSQNSLNSIRSYNIHDIAQSFKNWHLFAGVPSVGTNKFFVFELVNKLWLHNGFRDLYDSFNR